MKRITLFCMALLACGVGFAQIEMLVSETGGENNPVVYVQPNNSDSGPCGYNNESNDFENGYSCVKNLGRIVANDITVAPGESFTLESLTVNMFIGQTGSGVYASLVDIFFYDDDEGFPGSVIHSYLDYYPDLQNVVGTNYGFDVWELELDITDYTFNNVTGPPKTYWIGLSVEATDGSNTFWETSTVGLIDHGVAYDNNMGGGFVVFPDLEGVYFFTSNCQPLGVNDNALDLVQIYPNPVTHGIVNIETTIPGEKQVTIYDILGKKIIQDNLVSAQLDVSSLHSGMYLVQINQNETSVTKKLVIR